MVLYKVFTTVPFQQQQQMELWIFIEFLHCFNSDNIFKMLYLKTDSQFFHKSDLRICQRNIGGHSKNQLVFQLETRQKRPNYWRKNVAWIGIQFFNLLENSFNLLKSRSFIFSEIYKLGFINVNFTPEQDINWFSSICINFRNLYIKRL